MTFRPLQPFYRAIHQFPDALVVLRIHGVALGFPDLLKDHLLRGLGRDSSQDIGGLADPDFTLQRCFGIVFPRLFQADFMDGVLDLLDHLLHRVHFYLPALSIEMRLEVFRGFVILPRGHQDGILNCRDDNLRVDAFLTA